MSWRLVIPPAATPVTVAEARDHERIDVIDAAEDILIQNQLFAATRFAEEFTRRAFVFQTWEYRANRIRHVMEIPRPPLVRIIPNSEDPTSMVFTDLNDVTTVIEDDRWFQDIVNAPGHLQFKSTSSLPYPWPYWWGWGCYPFGYLTLKFEAGYGLDTATSIENVPWEIKEAILQIFGFLYRNREGQPIPCGSVAHTLLSPFKVEYL